MKSDQITADVSYFSAIGMRNYQEDRFMFSVEDYGWLLAVADGHLGDRTVIFCQEYLTQVFRATNSLIDTFHILHEQTKNFESGSTLSVVHIPKHASFAHVAILGDSPIIIKTKDGSINISPEHNARTNLSERQYAVLKGAHYADGYIWVENAGGHQLTRSLGDHAFRSVFNDEPEIYLIELGPESFVIVTSDGVSDPGHENAKKQIERISKMVENGADAKTLVDDALARKTMDNATAIVWKRK